MIEYSKTHIEKSLNELWGLDGKDLDLQISETRKEFEGDLTLVCFPLLRYSKLNPLVTAEKIGESLVKASNHFEKYNVVKGFLNLSLSEEFWFEYLDKTIGDEAFGRHPQNDGLHLIEFSSPNTNKPLHLGHLRNILIGDSIRKILEFSGDRVKSVQIINDRGIAICKSMYAWKTWGKAETPESSGMKGDHFVGKYYVLFNVELEKEYNTFQASDKAGEWYEEAHEKDQDESSFFSKQKNNYFNQFSAIGKAVKQMLLDWEKEDPDTRALWSKLNQWVYKGYDSTYDLLDVSFDKLYYESETYIKGKQIVQKGLADEAFYQKEDGSVWVDLEAQGLDQKILLRSDGTSVYITQDLGTAVSRYEDFKMSAMTYVVGNEQEYHFKVLFALLKMMGHGFANNLHHLSYGMVDLPDGKMKSREGTVVDADDLISEVIDLAKKNLLDRDRSKNHSDAELDEMANRIGLGALKFFILRVGAKKGMVFNPAESLEMQGQTGPYIQYSYVRIKSLLQRAKEEGLNWKDQTSTPDLSAQEKDLIIQMSSFPRVVKQAADNLDPSIMANYAYQTAKLYHRLWTDLAIFNADEELKLFRIYLSEKVQRVLQKSMYLLSIEMPNKM